MCLNGSVLDGTQRARRPVKGGKHGGVATRATLMREKVRWAGDGMRGERKVHDVFFCLTLLIFFCPLRGEGETDGIRYL